MIWPVAFDAYIPQEWANYLFDIHENMEEYTNPLELWFDRAEFYLWPRKWVSDKKNWSGYNVWKTEWNIVSWIKYWGRIRAYTDKWYVYNFDGKIVNVFSWLPTIITHNTWGFDFIVNNSTIWFIQEIETWANETVLSDVKFLIKAPTPVLWWDITVSIQDDNGDIITYADNILLTDALTDSYIEYKFNFSWVTLLPSTKYQFKVVINGTDSVNTISFERSNSDTYPAGDCYLIVPDNTLTLVWYDIRFNISTTRPFVYNSNIRKGILPLAYIGWWVFWVTATVTGYNNATRTVTIGSSILNSTYVAKFVYISAWVSANIRQVRQIESVQSATTFVVPVWFTPNISNGDTITFYTKKLSQLRFPQLRKGSSSPDSDSLVSIDREGFVNYFYYPNFKRLILWDNRIVALWQNEDGVVYSDQESLERFTLLSTTFWNDTAVNYAVYQSYLLVFFESTMGIIRRIDFTNPITGEISPIYKFNPTAATIWLYSERSFNYFISDFLLYGSDRIPYSVGITSSTLDEIKVDLEPFGREISNYTKKFDGGQVYLYNYHTNIMLVYKKDWITQNFVYKENTKNRYPHKYNIGWTFMDFVYDMGGIPYCWFNNTFVSLSWDTDLWDDIIQYLAISWPKTAQSDLTTLTSIKVKLWVENWKKLWLKMRLSLWWPNETIETYSSDNIQYIQDYNANILEESSLWSSQYGEDIIWSEENIYERKKIDNFFLYITPKKHIMNLLLELKNKDWSRLYIWWIYNYFSSMSANVIAPKLTMKDDKFLAF